MMIWKSDRDGDPNSSHSHGDRAVEVVELPLIVPPQRRAQSPVTRTSRVVVTPTLIGINVAMFVMMVVSGIDVLAPTADRLIHWGANFGPITINGQWWRLFTCMFIHVGIVHLAVNMWILSNVGQGMERILGHASFLILYFSTGLCGSLVSLWFNPLAVSAGASGALFGSYGGLLGFILRHPDSSTVDVLVGLRDSVLLFLACNLVFGLTVEAIDLEGHVGGLMAGLFCGLTMSPRPGRRTTVGRLCRNLFVATIAVMSIFGITLTVLEVSADVSAEVSAEVSAVIEQFSSLEETTSETYGRAVEQSVSGRISNLQFAEIVDRDILAPWRAAHERLVALGNVSPTHTQLVSTMKDYMQTRQESWELLVEALRENDADKGEQHRTKWALAEALGRELARRTRHLP